VSGGVVQRLCRLFVVCRNLIPIEYSITLDAAFDSAPPYGRVFVTHTYPHGSVVVRVSADPNAAGVNATVRLWSTDAYARDIAPDALSFWRRSLTVVQNGSNPISPFDFNFDLNPADPEAAW
jgi:hypothetical protein